MDDLELLQEFARRNSDEAFRTLVERHIDFVYSVALRQTHDPELANEATQSVFIDLAAKARVMPNKTILSGWLFRAVRFAASKAKRTEFRRQRREQEAAQMEPSFHEDNVEPTWEQMEPVLNEALEELSEKDRCAVLLRFFEKKPLKEVGMAMGLTEAAAKKRVSRAIEKLRLMFQQRGVVIPSAVLLATLSAQTLQAAPIGLASTIATTAILEGTALSCTTTLTLTKGILKLMAWSKLKTAAVAGAALITIGGTTTYVVHEVHVRAEDAELLRIITSLDSRELEKAPPRVFLREANPVTGRVGVVSLNGKTMGKEVTAAMLLSTAYGFSGSGRLGQSRIADPGTLPDKKYDFLVSLPTGQSEALKKAIRETLGLTARQETRDEAVYVLKAKPGDFPGLQSRPGQGGGGGGRQVVNRRMSRSSMSNKRGNAADADGDNLQLSNSTIAVLLGALENHFDRPLVDETGLSGHYDISLNWPSANSEDLKQALLDQLGLELVPGERPVEMLVVEKVTR